MVLAVSIDYCLFLFTRFGKELQQHGNFDLAIENSIRFAGHVVLMSGMTLIVSFLGFFILESPFIYNMGIGKVFFI